MHCPVYVGLCWLRHWILLVIRQNHHVFSLVAKVLVQVVAHVLDVVDAATELPFLAEIIDANEQSLPSTCTLRVLEIVTGWGAAAELLRVLGRWTRCIMVALDVGVLAYGWEGWTVLEGCRSSCNTQALTRPAVVSLGRLLASVDGLLRWWCLPVVRV